LIVKDSQKEFFAARVDPEVLEILKAEAEARGVKVSAIAREAFAEWIARHVENRCPWCGAVNLPGADWCGSCTAPLTATSRAKIGDEMDRMLDKITERNLTELERKLNEAFSQAQSKILAALETMEDLEDRAPARPRVREPGQEPITPEGQT
jgi:hypothetical protein